MFDGSGTWRCCESRARTAGEDDRTLSDEPAEYASRDAWIKEPRGKRYSELDCDASRGCNEIWPRNVLHYMVSYGRCLCPACAVRTFQLPQSIPPCTGSAHVRCHPPLQHSRRLRREDR